MPSKQSASTECMCIWLPISALSMPIAEARSAEVVTGTLHRLSPQHEARARTRYVVLSLGIVNLHCMFPSAHCAAWQVLAHLQS